MILLICWEELMAAPEPSSEPPRMPRKEAASPPASHEEPRQENADEGPQNPDDMTLEKFLDDVYYNPFGPSPGGT